MTRSREYKVPDRPLKGKLPFRLGCTSYVFPDDILPNVRAMAPVVDDIELVLFESEETSNLPSRGVILELSSISREYKTTYTVHLPTDTKAGSADAAERKRFVDQALRVMDLTAELEPHAYILHLEGITKTSSPALRREWDSRVRSVCNQLGLSQDSDRICIESLSYPVEWLMPHVLDSGFSLCLDVGHLWINGYNAQAICELHLPLTRVIHLHGVSEGKDHISLKKNDPTSVVRLIEMLRRTGYSGVVTLEVFSEADTMESLGVVDGLVF